MNLRRIRNKLQKNTPLLNKRYVVFITFCILTLLLKISSLLNTSVSADEATYIMAGNDLLNGKIFYIDIWDFKPIGIFLLIGLLYKYICSSILTIRIAGILFAALSAFIIYRIKITQGKKNIAIASGLVYILMISGQKLAIDTNTEIFFNLFTCSGLFFLIKDNKAVSKIISGFLFGLGFLIKYVVAFDIVGIFLALLILSCTYKDKKHTVSVVKNSVFAAIGFFIPLLILFSYYLKLGYHHELLDATFRGEKVYTSNISFVREIQFITDFHISYLPMIFVFYLGIIGRPVKNWIMPVLWFIMVWTAIILQGKHFTHYYIQLFIPVSIYSLDFTLFQYKINSRKIIKGVIIIFSIIYLGYSLYVQQKNICIKEDLARKAENYLQDKIEHIDKIFTSEQPLYFYLNKKPISKFYHSSILLNKVHLQSNTFNITDEYKYILNKKPKYIVLKKEYTNSSFINFFISDYELVKIIDRSLFIYKIK